MPGDSTLGSSLLLCGSSSLTGGGGSSLGEIFGSNLDHYHIINDLSSIKEILDYCEGCSLKMSFNCAVSEKITDMSLNLS